MQQQHSNGQQHHNINDMHQHQPTTRINDTRTTIVGSGANDGQWRATVEMNIMRQLVGGCSGGVGSVMVSMTTAAMMIVATLIMVCTETIEMIWVTMNTTTTTKQQQQQPQQWQQ